MSQKFAKNDSIDIDAASKFISTNAAVADYWKPILTKNVKTCADEVSKRKAEMIDSLKNEDKAMQLDSTKCNISYLAFALCTIAVDFPVRNI